MKKFAKYLWLVALAAVLLWCASVVKDNQTLKESVIRLHVVGASDSQEDQQLKLMVRDAVLESLQQELEDLPDTEAAKEYLREKLPQIQKIVNGVLTQSGSAQKAEVTLERERFDRRQYDTFSLPAGVYESLRIRIGDAQGKNWWCVVFPSLCMPAVSDGFADTAAGAGFNDTLTDTLQQKPGFTIRFFFLDCLGWLENLFFRK